MKLRMVIFLVFLAIGGCFAQRYNNAHVTVPTRQCDDMSVMTGQRTTMFNEKCYIEVQGERFVPVALVKDWVAFVRGLPPKQSKVQIVDNPFEN